MAADLLTQHVRRLRAAPLAGLPDADLLDRFVRGGPESGPAFEVVVRRHGPMVLAACRGEMGDPHAADDCFQAVFLVLVRKAGGLRLRGPLGPWLFEVARRVCSRAKASSTRRSRHEARASKVDISAPAGGLDPDVMAAVHAEVGRLPRMLRASVILCDLAGLTYEEAAARLGLTRATVRGRLARGRERLRRRLCQQGIRPEAVWATAIVVPAALVEATASASDVMGGRAAGAVSAGVLELVKGGLHSMVMTKLKAAGLSALAGSVLVAGALSLGAQSTPSNPAPSPEGQDPTVGLVAILNQVEDDSDAGDEVAALVRKAQRQQDRGDVRGAAKTLGQVDAALEQWRTRLVPPAGRTTTATSPAAVGPEGAAQAPFPGGRGQPSVGQAMAPPAGAGGGMSTGGFGRGGGRSASAPARQPDLEARLKEVEAKLDKLLKQMEEQHNKKDGARR